MAKVPSPVAVPLKETSNHPEGRSGAGAPITYGPAVGKTSGNTTMDGGINRSTSPKKGGGNFSPGKK